LDSSYRLVSLKDLYVPRSYQLLPYTFPGPIMLLPPLIERLRQPYLTLAPLQVSVIAIKIGIRVKLQYFGQRLPELLTLGLVERNLFLQRKPRAD